MKILLTGMQPGFGLETLKRRMAQFGPVTEVQAVDDGDPEQPWAIVDMAVGTAEATDIARRIDGIYHVDRFIRARVMLRS